VACVPLFPVVKGVNGGSQRAQTRVKEQPPQTQANNTALYLDPSTWQLIQFTTRSSDI